ncbi:S-layer homology domain-containing protein [Paenibacillus woosongensis]|uniref:S-layer homology domain-containing protein n=1 Tax=Paenibacillus woosongensis TaxID=307580 RepID=A0AA95I4G1_9BACL|nr:S-layer homology domain-containing protein [Paenibacillus woosongensis]WHX50354.1 S-layer homology domain-containing protein [Paenibacillus woosongensis]
MLTKAYALRGGVMGTPEAAESFADAVQIADWAQASVNAAHALGLIQGRGQGEFAPAASYSFGSSWGSRILAPGLGLTPVFSLWSQIN